MRYFKALILLLVMTTTSTVFAKNTKFKKTQEVNFDGVDIDGTRRSPDGAYLLQKRGVKFMPLYRVNLQLEKNISDSVEYLR